MIKDIILIACLGIFSIDIGIMLIRWRGRIHIGRYDSILTWKNKINKKNLKWLMNAPHVKVSDEERWVLIDFIRGCNKNRNIQYWQEAALILGSIEENQETEQPVFEHHFKKLIKRKFTNEGKWIKNPSTIEAAMLMYAFMQNRCFDKEVYRPAANYVWEIIKEHIGEDGTVMYRKYMPQYRYVDTIGLICPFLIKYGLVYDRRESVELAMNQINNYMQYGMSEHIKIPFHVYQINRGYQLGLQGWGRGLGWFVIGLMDMWRELPEEDPYKEQLALMIEEYAKIIIEIQHGSGGWTWVVTRTEGRVDSSATAVLGWFLVCAAEIESIHEQCMEAAGKAIRYLMSVTRKSGAIDFSQGDTKDIGVYSMNFDILPFTQGFAVRLINMYMGRMEHIDENYSMYTYI